MKKLILILILLNGLVAVSFSDNEWKSVAKLQAGGSAKEVSVNQQISKISLVCSDGSIVIKSLEVTSGGKKLPYSLDSKLNKGESQQVSVGNSIDCSKIRITDEGRGEYQVRVKK